MRLVPETTIVAARVRRQFVFWLAIAAEHAVEESLHEAATTIWKGYAATVAAEIVSAS